MSEALSIEVSDNDEVQLVGYRWLAQHGHGSQPTIWRKVKAGTFPKPI